MGLSLHPSSPCSAWILGKHAGPGRSTLHRWIKAAGTAAGRVLKALDSQCRALVLVGCLDEIFFHGRPVLVGVEPASMAWFLGRKANDRSGATWAKALRDWDALSFVTADAGTGLQTGIATVQQERREECRPALENGLDVFHTTYEARRVSRLSWNRVERLWEQAEIAAGSKSRGGKAGMRGAAVVGVAWKKAEAAFAQHACEAGWKICTRPLLRPEGHLNDRAWAEQQIATRCPCCRVASGPRWGTSSRYKEALTFLVCSTEREAIPEDQLRVELVHLWWLRRQRPRANSMGAVAGAGHVAHVVQQLVCQKVDANWQQSYAAVARVLRLTVRASSAVEGMNGVLRMHQSRHKTVTQGLLVLKRLYWNCHAFREGKRRGRCPYEHLGLKLPSYRFWDLLWMPIPAAEAI